MMKANRSLARVPLALVAVALIAAACGGDDESAAGGNGGSEELSGEIVVSGSSTVEPISVAVAQKFSSQNPNVEIAVEGPGTSDGFELFCNGETDVSDASRPIDPAEEVPACKENGIQFIELKVGIDGLSVITSAENNDVECLDFKDLYALLGIESEGFDQWSDANELGQEIGAGHVPYPDEPLDVTAPGEESGTYDSFAEIVLEDIAYEERKVPEDDPVVRPDYQASANDTVILEGVAGSPASLGWVGYAFARQGEGQVKPLPIADGEGGSCVEPNDETIQSGEYPIARDLFVYVNKGKMEENPSLEAFVDFYLSEEGIASVPEVGYVELAEDDLQATRDAWEAKGAGTREG